MRVAALAAAAVTVAACGGSSNDGSGMVITPPPTPIVEPATSVAEAVTSDTAVVIPNGRVRARIETSRAAQYFRVPVSEPGILTLGVTGDVRVRILDRDGNELAASGSSTVAITREIISQGAVIVEVTPEPDVSSGIYALLNTFTARTGTPTAATMMMIPSG